MRRGSCAGGALAIACLAACSQGSSLVLLPPAGHASLLIVGRAPEGPIVEARAAADRVELSLALADGGEVTALFYASTLAGLGLAEGRVPLSPSGRPLPRAELGAFRAPAGGAWAPVEEVALRLDDVRIADLDVLACLDAGGCPSGPRGPSLRCELPCAAFAPLTEPTPPAEPRPPSAPSPPAPPRFRPCPEGWSESSDEACAPPLAPPRASCARGERQPAGAGACAAIGAACPAGEWAAPPPSGAFAYVRAGQRDEGDGTALDPYGSLERAVRLGPPGATLLLGRGAHRAPTTELRGPVRWRGACAAETTVELDAGRALAIVGGRLESLGVTGADAGLALTGTGALALEGVHLSGGSVAALRVASGTAAVRDSVLEGALALSVTGGARVVLEDATLDGELAAQASTVSIARSSLRSDTAQVVLAMRARVALEDVLLEGGRQHGVAAIASTVAISRAELRGDDAAGDAVFAIDGAQVSGEALAVHGRTGWAFFVHGARTAVALSDVWMDGRARTDGGFAAALASLRLARIHTIGGSHRAISVEEARLELSDLWIEGVEAPLDEQGLPRDGDGLRARGSTVTARRVRVDRAEGDAVELFGAGTASISDLIVDAPIRVNDRVDAGLARVFTRVADRRALHASGSRVSVEDLEASASVPSSLGFVEAIGGAALSITRADFVTPSGRVIGADERSSLELDDLRISDPRPTLEEGRGGCVYAAGPAVGARWSLSGCRGYGVWVRDQSETTVEDLRVERVLFDPLLDDRAFAVEVDPGARLTLERAVFAEVLDYGLHASGQALVNASDLSIRGVRGHGPERELDAFGLYISSHGSFARVRVDDAPVGVTAAAGTDKRLSFSDLELSSTRRALIGGASGGIARVRVRDAERAVEVTGTRARLSELEVEGAGVGLFFANGADVEVTRFRLREIGEAAVVVREEGPSGLPSVRLVEGSLEDVARTFEVPPGYDLSPLGERVRRGD